MKGKRKKGTSMSTYKALVTYNVDGGTCEYYREDFNGVDEATRWAFARMTNIALHYGEIAPYGGLKVDAEITADGYCDSYSLVCG